MFFSHIIQVPHTLLQRGWGSRDITAESTDRIAYKSLKMLTKCWNRSHAFWSVRASIGAFSPASRRVTPKQVSAWCLLRALGRRHFNSGLVVSCTVLVPTSI